MEKKQCLNIRNFALLTIAGLVNATGISLFLTPMKLYDSGISGTSMLLDRLTPDWMFLSIFLLLLNIPLFLFGLKKQGKTFTIYAVYTVIMYSIFAYMYGMIFDLSEISPIAKSDILLCAIFGGMLSGGGSGLAIRFGGAMDGMEVMAIIFAKKLGITVGTFVMIYNTLLYIVCGIITRSWIIPLYSIIAYYVGL